MALGSGNFNPFSLAGVNPPGGGSASGSSITGGLTSIVDPNTGIAVRTPRGIRLDKDVDLFGVPGDRTGFNETSLDFLRLAFEQDEAANEDRERATQEALVTLRGNQDNPFDPRTNAFTSFGQANRGLQGTIEDIFASQRGDIENALPVDPFTDELVGQRTQFANDAILQEVQAALGLTARDLQASGIRGGGASAGAGALVQGAGIQARAGALQSILGQQFETNTQSNALRSQLLNQLAATESGQVSRIGQLAAALQAGDVDDPALRVQTLGDLFAADRAREEGLRNIELERFLASGAADDEFFDNFLNASSRGLAGSDLSNSIFNFIPEGLNIGRDFLTRLFGRTG